MESNNENLGKKNYLHNDDEVKDILLHKNSSASKEKSLSPILNGGLNIRKYLIGRRLSSKTSSRVRLTDRFESEKKEVLVRPIDLSIPLSLDDSLSVTQSEKLIDHLDKLEELEDNKINIYKALVGNNENTDNTSRAPFKIPKSPALSKVRKVTNSPSVSNTTLNLGFKELLINKVPPVSLTASTGFKTATGKSIPVSDSEINRYSKLFKDILHPTKPSDEGRQNKYSFLSKKHYREDNITGKQVSHSSRGNNLNGSLKFMELNKEHLVLMPSSDFKAASGSHAKLSKEVIKHTTNFFAEKEFSDAVITNENEELKNICVTTAISIHNYKNDLGSNNNEDTQQSLTQAICNSEISNTHILRAVDGILCSDENNKTHGFKGFTKEDVLDSCMKFHDMKKLHTKLDTSLHYKEQEYATLRTNYLCKKRTIENFLLPPNKRHCNAESDLDSANMSLPKENYLMRSYPNTRGYFLENKSSLNICNIGFSRASGKSIVVSEKSLKKAKKLFDALEGVGDDNMQGFETNNIFENNVEDKFKKKSFKTEIKNNINKYNQSELVSQDVANRNCNIDYCRASGSDIVISKESLKKAKKVFHEIEDAGDNIMDFKTNNLVESNLENTSEYANFQNEISNIENKCNQKEVANANHNSMGFFKASGNAIVISEKSLEKAKSIFDNLDISDQNEISTLTGEISPASGNTNLVQERQLKSKNTVIKNIEYLNSKGTKIFENIDRSNQNEESTLIEGVATVASITKLDQDLHENFKNISDIQKTPGNVKNLDKSGYSNCNSKFKKNLGVSRCKLIKIPDSKLDKAKFLFNEDLSAISPMKPRQSVTCTSTPVRQNIHSTPMKSDLLCPRLSFSKFVEAADITPIKKHVESDIETSIYTVDSDILCTSPTKGNWMEDIVSEMNQLENRLKILSERHMLGQKAKQDVERGKANCDKKPRKGILYTLKTENNCRMPLVTFVENNKPGTISTTIKIPISGKNVIKMHFKGKNTGSIVTTDGAVVIPNSKDLVGLSEINNAFEAMPGVEPRLLPKGWLSNHYRWIVWKLASYENMFPNYFQGCLSIENIVQQLKYRYDREIDRAERSALRKIYEKDDSPQKRMVLFVADIKVLEAKKYELELSDGWYAIRTIIDEPLCNQIINGKISIGTKLIISGAEILNCDGCYPLEATNLVCLKINSNSTRRAIWHAKLGYQQNPNPFPIRLQTILPHGGNVTAIKVCILRAYPLKYLEKLEGRSVWRNKKAEERAAQKWEMENSKKIEEIQDKIRKEFEDSRKSLSYKTPLGCDISSIRCPKMLHEMIEISNDPECLQECLSTSQREAVLHYQQNLSMKNQQQIAAQISNNIAKLKLSKRDVVAVFKLLIIDFNSVCGKAFNFLIWRPTEVHLQSLKEGKSFTIQNVVPRANGDLTSNTKTTFKMESSCNNVCSKYKRRLVHISELTELKVIPNFNEFDTVGMVVQVKIDSHTQEVWITDSEARLLFITVSEGPDTCLLLDNLKTGQPITICNLIYSGLKKDIVHAIANHFTVFSSYSQHRHLQEGLDLFKKEFSKDLRNLLNDCDSKIEVFRLLLDFKNSLSETFEATDENTLFSS